MTPDEFEHIHIGASLLKRRIDRKVSKMESKIEIKPLEEVDGKIVYECGGCGASGIRLWRRYNSFMGSQSLACRSCSEIEQGKEMGKGSDQIGWRIPAATTEEGDTFWGYSSVPDDRVQWWLDMPEERSMNGVLYDFTLENSPFSIIEISRMTGRAEYVKFFIGHRDSDELQGRKAAIYESSGMIAVMMEDMKHRDEDKYTYKVTLTSCDSNGRLSAQRSKHVRFFSESPEGVTEEQHEGSTPIRL